MTDMDIDLYEDLDVIPNKFEQEKKELVEKHDKLKREYEKVKRELDDLRKENSAALTAESSLKILRANYDSVLLTAQKEIERLKRQIETVQKEKDDVVFRRARPKENFRGHVREKFTQTSWVKKMVNSGVQTEESRRKDIYHEGDTRIKDTRNDKKDSRDRLKRLRSRSRDKSSRSSSKNSGSDNDRKRARYEIEEKDKRRDKDYYRRNRRRSSEKEPAEQKQEASKQVTRTIVTRELKRLSEEMTHKIVTNNGKDNVAISSEQQTKEILVKSKRKSKTPKKSPKNNFDTIEKELESLMCQNGNKIEEPTIILSESKQEPQSIVSEINSKVKGRRDSTGDLRMLLEAKKFQKSFENQTTKEKRSKKVDYKEKEEAQNLFAKSHKDGKKYEKQQKVEKDKISVNIDDKKKNKINKRPLELLWQEREVEFNNKEFQNTAEHFRNQNSLYQKKLTKDEELNQKRQQLLRELFSDSSSVSCSQKVYSTVVTDDLEDGEILDDPSSVETNDKKNPVKIKQSNAKEEDLLQKKSPTWDKKSVCKIVPGTVDDSACDLGEMIQHQTTLVHNEKEPFEEIRETLIGAPELIEQKVVDTKVHENVISEVEQFTVESKVSPENDEKFEKGFQEEINSNQPERLIELSDLVMSQVSTSSSSSNILSNRSIESIAMQNFGDQSNISLLIAADIFLQNENTMKSMEEKLAVNSEQMSPKSVELDNVPCKSQLENEIPCLEGQEIVKSPRNNSNDSLKENICTPVPNQSNTLHNHGATPKTTTKTEPKQLLTQFNNGPDSSIPTPDTSKDVTGEQLSSINVTGEDSLNSSAKRRVIETKSTQYVVEETEDMVICTVTRKKRKKEKKEKKHKKHKERNNIGENM